MSNPGWYPDPSGAPQQRWWDGQAWSEATQSYAAPPAPAATPVYAVPVQAVPVYVAPPAPPAPRRDPAESARRGFTLGIIGGSLSIAGFLITAIGGSVAALNWMLFLGLVLVLAATVVGIVGVVFSASGLSRSTEQVPRQRATIGLVGSIVGVGAFFLLLLGSALSTAL